MPTAARLVKRRAGFVIGSGGTLHYDCPRSVRITYASTFNRLTTIFRGRPPVHSPPPTRRPSHPASARSRRLVFSSSSSSSSSTEPWKPGSWRLKPIHQQPEYPDREALSQVERRLARMPPLIYPGETRKLLQRLEAVGRGEAFLLQGGDCAETFADFSPQKVHSTFCTLIGQAIALALASGLPIVKIGRIAGQFAKPRSLPHDASGLPSYRGDIVHSAEPNAQARVPDPERLIKAYSQSAAAMNLIRALAKSTSSMMDWLQQMEMLLRRHGALDTPFGARMHQFMEEVEDSLRFVHACGIDENSGSFTEPEFYTSHEALLLNYEEALTHRFVRNMPIWEEEEEEVQLAAASHGSAADASGTYFATSAHFMWIGERTRQLDAAHVEFLRGIANPVGIKASAKMTPQELLTLLDAVNPQNALGRVTLITRMGADGIGRALPPLMRAVQQYGRQVVWSCDPMHGNTESVTTASGRTYKTRYVDGVLREVRTFFDVAHAEGCIAGGLHLEMTGEAVTECVGGLVGVDVNDLDQRYRSACDPRLNQAQALEVAFAVGELLRAREQARRHRGAPNICAAVG
ncbi:hypothetical protein CDCA_CDCA12G3494 [Cyanidium caldarium]|uniref:Phospho-2-dehydro-3-deoxyheptonate aldolase n=1 Tax=Cyanidium caldarium TaxID=2771 RepID=A0AAV9IZG9_CYACA|nr:hypothetical protein CDCA_CDCA12G3494 [Cyanidium caldarium]